MNDKEYTYDIDKYTIGVDTNGEDGIGLTVAIIKNGEINFLGNCYGENARCIDLLIKENQELKKQLEEYKKDIEDLDNQKQRAFKNMQLNQLKVCNMIKQQKEFINYLEDEIQKLKERDIYQPLQRMALVTLEHNLQKYKKIIGGRNE